MILDFLFGKYDNGLTVCVRQGLFTLSRHDAEFTCFLFLIYKISDKIIDKQKYIDILYAINKLQTLANVTLYGIQEHFFLVYPYNLNIS